MDKKKDQKDQLMDELLKEHAKHGTEHDEAFLKELQQRVENEPLLKEGKRAPFPFARWASITGLAACVVIGAMAIVVVDTEYGEAPSPELSMMQAPQPAPASRKPSVMNEVAETELMMDFASSDEGFLAEHTMDFGGDSAAGAVLSAVQPQAMLRANGHAAKVKRAPEWQMMVPNPNEPVVRQKGEKYGVLIDNPWKAPVDERSSLSTFAVDVDTASYTNIRRMINDGYREIPADAVRIEEMVNYFDYQYAQPADEHPFAVHVDTGAAPWNPKHRLVRVGLQAKEMVRTERPSANLVFLLDVSGSMSSDNKLPLLKRSMQYLLEELNENDSVSIVVYAGSSGLALPATKMDDRGRQAVLAKMDSLSAGGSTAGGAGIKLAYKVAQEQFVKGGVNRIILATDGDFNVGVSGTDELTKLVKQKAKGGTYLSVLGFGHGNINDEMMESITNNGNGNYHYIDSIKEGRKVLLEDMMGTMVTVAKDVKVQVQMNPSKVKAYRLIGYANRMLPPEAFLDKTVDAGEIGAGHTVTALYEIIPADGKPFKQGVDGLRYFEKVQPKPAAEVKPSSELCHVKLAYKGPGQKVEDESTYLDVPFVDAGATQGAKDHRFASAVALFGMVLRDSEFKGEADLELVLKLAKAAQGNDGKGQRSEFIQLVEMLQQKE